MESIHPEARNHPAKLSRRHRALRRFWGKALQRGAETNTVTEEKLALEDQTGVIIHQPATVPAK